MSQRTRAITQFADAVSAAAGLEALYGRFAAAALLDDEDGTILDMRPFTGEATCVMCALEWALGVADDWRSAHRVVLLSGGGGSLRELREDDIRMYQTLRETLDGYDIELVDWIQTDGDDIRSLTFTCDISPNWDDPPATS
jgi:hypothetical protein